MRHRSKEKWVWSDRPFDSEFLEGTTGMFAARVKPGSEYPYTWSIWFGSPGRRVLHDSGSASTRARAKSAAKTALTKHEAWWRKTRARSIA